MSKPLRASALARRLVALDHATAKAGAATAVDDDASLRRVARLYRAWDQALEALTRTASVDVIDLRAKAVAFQHLEGEGCDAGVMFDLARSIAADTAVLAQTLR